MTSILTARYRGSYVNVDFDVGVGVNERDRTRWVSEKLKPNAVTIKRLLGFEKNVPPTVPDEVDHKAAEDSSTSRATWKSNKKSGCYWREDSMLLKLSF